MKAPGIAVTYNKELTLDISLPDVGKTSHVRQAIDLGLQKMELQSVARTSDSTATLLFKLNTDGNKSARIWYADIIGESLEKGQLLWENGMCTMNVTFDKSVSGLNLLVQSPTFIVDGNWTFTIA